jgi:hypothetical protein
MTIAVRKPPWPMELAMTRNRERGENEYTRRAKAEAQREKTDACTVLARYLQEARDRNDTAAIEKIRRAEKYLGCRNVRRRRST